MANGTRIMLRMGRGWSAVGEMCSRRMEQGELKEMGNRTKKEKIWKQWLDKIGNVTGILCYINSVISLLFTLHGSDVPSSKSSEFKREQEIYKHTNTQP